MTVNQLPIIFCPSCELLIWQAEQCPHCFWSRPPVSGKPGSILWQKEIEGVFGKQTSLTAVDSLVISCSELESYEVKGNSAVKQGLIQAFDVQTGETKWRYPLETGRLCRFPVVMGDLVLIGSEDTRPLASASNELIALEVQTGKERWRVSAQAHSMSPPAVCGNTLFFTTSSQQGWLVTSQGEVEIEGHFNKLPRWSPYPPVLTDQYIFINSRSEHITVINRLTKERFLLGGLANDLWFDEPPYYENGFIYAIGRDKNLYAFEVAQHTLTWKQELGRGTTSFLAGGKHLYVGVKLEEKGQYALNAYEKNSGKLVWQIKSPKYFEAPVVAHKGQLFVGNSEGWVLALDEESGAQKWAYQIPQDKVTIGPAVNEQALAIGTRKGNLFTFVWQVKQNQYHLQAPETHERAGEWEQAGLSAALQKLYMEAARFYGRAGYPYRQAQLLEAAEAWPEAAGEYRRIGRYELALLAYQKGDLVKGQAEMHLELNQFEAAAELYVTIQQFESAAQAYEKAGLLRKAAEQYLNARLFDQAVHLYLQLNEALTAAEVRERQQKLAEAEKILLEAGLTKEAAEMWIRHQQYETAAGLYEKMGQMSLAAQMWEHAQNPAKAAEKYEKNGQWGEAAALWVKVGDLAKATDLYLRANKLEEAMHLYVQRKMFNEALQQAEKLKDMQKIEEMAQEFGQWEEAAVIFMRAKMTQKAGYAYAQAGNWVAAAKVYESLRQKEAADCWEKGGEPLKAARYLRDLGYKEEAARLFEKCGQFREAAALWADMRRIPEAVRLYKEAGQAAEALKLVMDGGDWLKVRDLARELNQFEQEAEASLKLAEQAQGDAIYDYYIAAAQSFERAAKDYEISGQKDAEYCADLWVKAVHFFREGYEENEELIARCDYEMRRLRKWPILQVSISSDKELVEDEFHELSIEIFNEGHGLARLPSVKVEGHFFEGREIDTTQHLKSLRPGGKAVLRLPVKPKQVGSAVPIEITLTYVLPNNETFERQVKGRIAVRRRDSQSISQSMLAYNPHLPQPSQTIIHVGGDYVVGQKGDSVSVSRPGVQSAPLAPAGDENVRLCPECRTANAPTAKFCGNCRTEL